MKSLGWLPFQGARSMAADPEALLARADRMARRGQRDAAKSAYLELLKIAPDHFGALNNLGALLADMGFRTAARTAYARAVACHPGNPTGHANLANALRNDGDLAAAREHAERALRLAPDHAGAHRVMANILFDCGEQDKAARHRDAGYTNHPAIRIPCRGECKPVSLLMLVSAVGGNVPIRHLVDDTVFDTTVIYADYWVRPLPLHDLALNAIGDADLCADAMHAACRLLAATSAPVLNAPQRALMTGRAANARRLAGIAGVRSARTISVPRNVLCGADGGDAIRGAGLRFPLLLRSPGFHTGQHFERVSTAEELPEVAARLPGDDLMAMEYLDASGADGVPRKYRAMFIGGEILPLHLAVSHDWKVHYFTAAMGESAEYRAEEARYLNDMPGAIGQKAHTALAAIRDALGLDYAGIDFGLNARGELLLFETNATMVILPPGSDPKWDYRRAAIARAESAFRAMLAQRAGVNLRKAA